ncbi:hypothetical protein PG993_009273 [Apiospora rasikravindrae]|uniref:Uncharacterized protein n=1 Tax=Apiospora rasikravindrae TaxID=990691 RepID=A0ABR1SLB8_9PEZI
MSAGGTARDKQSMHFYVVINPNSEPKNTLVSSGRISMGNSYTLHGHNKDWWTNVDRLNQVPDTQTLEHFYARHGHRDRRSVEQIGRDI